MESPEQEVRDVAVGLTRLVNAVKKVHEGPVGDIALAHMLIRLPRGLMRLSKCWWRWLLRSHFVLPGEERWAVDAAYVTRLSAEFGPRRGNVQRPPGTVPISRIMEKWSLKELPPGWRKELRDIAKGFYTYFAPDGASFSTSAKAQEHFVALAQREIAANPAAAAQYGGEGLSDAADAAPAAGAGGEVAAAAASGAEGVGPGDKGAQVVVSGAGGGRGEEDGADGELVERGQREEDARMETGSQSDGMADEERAGESGGDPAPRAADEDGSELAFSCCVCCGHAQCVNAEAAALGPDFAAAPARDETLAPHFAALLSGHLVLLRNLARSSDGGRKRVGSHATTLQILVECIAPRAPRSLRDTSLDLLITVPAAPPRRRPAAPPPPRRRRAPPRRRAAAPPRRAGAHAPPPPPRRRSRAGRGWGQVADVVNLRVAPGTRLLSSAAQGLAAPHAGAGYTLHLALLVARLADCEHNAQAGRPARPLRQRGAAHCYIVRSAVSCTAPPPPLEPFLPPLSRRRRGRC